MPLKDEIKDLAQKFNFDIDEYGLEGFVKYLSDYLLDDTDLIAITPNPSDETFHIVKKQAHYAGYLGSSLFFKMDDIIELLWSAIGIHTIFDLQFPERIQNLAIFLMTYFKNEKIFGSKGKSKLPNIVVKKLAKDGIEL